MSTILLFRDVAAHENGLLLNTSFDAASGQNFGIQGNYSEILDRLASSLDSPMKFLQDGIYSKQKYSPNGCQINSDCLPHHTEPESIRKFSSDRKILMSSSNETLYETPSDNGIELSSDNSNESNHMIQNSDYKTMKHLRSFISDPSQKGQFVCPVDGCGKVFTRKANGRAHIETHNPHRARPYACSKCFKSYLRSIDLLRHIDTTHDRIQKHLCPDCGRRFTRKEGLKKHKKRGICAFSNFSSRW